MKFKIGMVVYSYSVDGGKISLTEYHLVSIRRPRRDSLEKRCGIVRVPRAKFVAKIKGDTWVRKSNKVGDYGWAKRPANLWVHWVRVDEGRLPLWMYSTKLQAAKVLLRYKEESYRRLQKNFEARDDYWDAEEWVEVLAEAKKDVMACKRNVTRVRNARGVKKK